MKPKTNRWSIVIPLYQTIPFIDRNLPQILKLGADQIIMVDDASPDNDAEHVKQNYPQVEIYRNEKNLGFGSTVNRGVSYATGDYLLLLNIDTFPEQDILPILEKDFQDPDVFGVSLAEQECGPTKMIISDGYIAHAPITPRPTKITDSFWISDGSGAFRKSMWDQLDGFDPLYDPYYWEDIDLCYRARQRGWKSLWNPDAHIQHYHGSTIGKATDPILKSRIQERNQLLFTWKHLPPKFWTWHLAHLIKRTILHPGYARVIAMALQKRIH